jgi:hypothetical protein
MTWNGRWYYEASSRAVAEARRIRGRRRWPTTGARLQGQNRGFHRCGGIFNGALSVALAEGKAVLAAVRIANAAAALSVIRLGVQPSAPTRADIEKFLRRRR